MEFDADFLAARGIILGEDDTFSILSEATATTTTTETISASPSPTPSVASSSCSSSISARVDGKRSYPQSGDGACAAELCGDDDDVHLFAHPVPAKKASSTQQQHDKKKMPTQHQKHQQQRRPLNVVALDCEMVGVLRGKSTNSVEPPESALARCTIVDLDGRILLDTFVKPMHKIVDYRTAVSGVRAENLVDAPTFSSVRTKVLEILNKADRICGHSLAYDFHALRVKMGPYQHAIRDTAQYIPVRERVGLPATRIPSLKALAKLLLKRDIQGAEHSSVEDARTSLALYKRLQPAWENQIERQAAAVVMVEAGEQEER